MPRPAQSPVQSLEDDPLFELARIVAGKPSSGGTGSVRPERSALGNGAAIPAEQDLTRDLESELLNELQASFSIIPEQTPVSRQPAPPPQISLSPTNRSEPPPRPPAAERTERVPPPKPEPRLPRVDRIAVAPAPSSPDRAAAFRPPQAPAGEFGAMQFRPTAVPGPSAQAPAPPKAAEAVIATPSSRWERPEKARPPLASAGRTAPARPEPPPQEPEPAVDFEDWDFLLEESGSEEAVADLDMAAPFEEFDAVPGYADDELLPPFPEEELATLRSRRPSRTLFIVAGILAVLLVATASLVLFRSGESKSTPPQIIAADPSPTKVQPDTGAAPEDDSQSKLIYDRVNPSADAANSQLAAQNDQPVADVTAATADNSNPISRVILPGGPGVDAPDDGAGAAAMDAGATGADENGIEPIGPKKVRTVVVRPDGTIVSSAAAPADGTAGPDQQGSAALGNPAAPTGVAPAANSGGSDIAALETESAAGGSVGARDAKGNVLPLGDANAPITSAKTGGGTPAPAPQAAPASSEAVATAEPASASAPEPQTRPAKRPSAANDGGTPIDLVPGQQSGGQVRQAALAGTGGYLVQVSSQRSEEAATSTFRGLQSRFPSILGGYQPDIQRADLGAKGVYYRVRVGPFGQGEAQQICDSLKSAGGDCILAQR